jgi:hypothetical protein
MIKAKDTMEYDCYSMKKSLERNDHTKGSNQEWKETMEYIIGAGWNERKCKRNQHSNTIDIGKQVGANYMWIKRLKKAKDPMEYYWYRMEKS